LSSQTAAEIIPYKFSLANTCFLPSSTNQEERKSGSAVLSASTIIYKIRRKEFSIFENPTCQQVFQAVAVGYVQYESAHTIALFFF
jgi:hypothetical protein